MSMRNCDKFRDVNYAYERFMAYIRRMNPGYRNPSPLHTVWDALKWALSGDDNKPDEPKKIWLVVHEEHEAGGSTEKVVAHICDSRLKAEEWLERDGAFIANFRDSEIRSSCYKGSKGDFDYRYYIEEMEVDI